MRRWIRRSLQRFYKAGVFALIIRLISYTLTFPLHELFPGGYFYPSPPEGSTCYSLFLAVVRQALQHAQLILIMDHTTVFISLRSQPITNVLNYTNELHAHNSVRKVLLCACLVRSFGMHELCNMDTFFAFMVLHCVKATFLCRDADGKTHT